MRKKFGRTVRTMGLALVLASGAGIVLGTAPASAAEPKFMKYQLANYHGERPPSQSAAIAETRPAADRECVQTYGFRARGVEPGMVYGKTESGTLNWYQPWRCYSN